MSAAASIETASAAPLLEVRDIEKAFPGVRALSGVTVRPWPAMEPKNPARPANEHADGSGMNEGSRRKTC
jgi:hypothetical protein